MRPGEERSRTLVKQTVAINSYSTASDNDTTLGNNDNMTSPLQHYDMLPWRVREIKHDHLISHLAALEAILALVTVHYKIF